MVMVLWESAPDEEKNDDHDQDSQESLHTQLLLLRN